MKAIYGLYADADTADRAVNILRKAARDLGFDGDNIQAVSSEPFEDHEFSRRDRETPMPWLAAVGGLVGGLSGYFLAALSQQAYPLPTGGMPIVALWTDGIVTYEMTMLGAILATLLVLLGSARLPDWGRRLYDPEISDGKILIGVINPPEELRAGLEGKLREAGASQVKEFSCP